MAGLGGAIAAAPAPWAHPEQRALRDAGRRLSQRRFRRTRATTTF